MTLRELIVFAALSMVAATARYFNEVASQHADFRWKQWLFIVVSSVFIGVIAGLFCNHYNMSSEITHVIVGLSALSSRELIPLVPKIAVEIVRHLGQRYTTKEIYHEHPKSDNPNSTDTEKVRSVPRRH